MKQNIIILKIFILILSILVITNIQIKIVRAKEVYQFTTNNLVNLVQLDEEVKNALGLSAKLGLSFSKETDDSSTTITVHFENQNITPSQDQLNIVQQAIANHIANEETVPSDNVSIPAMSKLADIAENIVSDFGLISGQLVAVSPEKGFTPASSKDRRLLGIISTNPAILLNQEVKGLPMALNGKVPTIVSSQNGIVLLGDSITTSAIPGTGAKAINYSMSVGTALESSQNWNSDICPAVSSVEAIQWPDDDGTNSAKPCFTLPDGTFIGKLMVMVNVGIYDPDILLLTDTGDLLISDPQIPYEEFLSATSAEDLRNQAYTVKNKDNQLIERLAAFSDIVSGKIRSGLVDTNNLIAQNMVVSRALLGDLAANTLSVKEKLTAQNADIAQISSEKITSQSVDVDTIKVAEITTLEDQDLNINLPDGSKLVIENNDQVVTSMDSNGNATFSGQLTANSSYFGQLIVGDSASSSDIALKVNGSVQIEGQLSALEISADNLKTKDTTVSGTLYADQIESKQIEDMQSALGQLLTKVDQLGTTPTPTIEAATPTPTVEITPTPTLEATPTASPSPEASSSADLINSDIDQLLAEILGTSTPDTDTTQTTVPDDINLISPINPIPNSLANLGEAVSLSNNLTLTANTINTSQGPLYIQNLAMNSLDIMGGKVVIDKNGNTRFEGDVVITGALAASSLKPVDGSIVIDLSSIPTSSPLSFEPDEAASSSGGLSPSLLGKLIFKGNDGLEVASVDASGSAKFNTLAINNLNINADYSATDSGVLIAAADNYAQNGIFAPAIKSNATSGVAILPAGQTQVLIYNDKISDKSLIYITPTTPTENKVMYVKNKYSSSSDQETPETDQTYAESWFTVGIDTPISTSITFNWWVVN